MNRKIVTIPSQRVSLVNQLYRDAFPRRTLFSLLRLLLELPPPLHEQHSADYRGIYLSGANSSTVKCQGRH